MTIKKYCTAVRSPAPSSILPASEQLSEVTGCRRSAYIINRYGMRLLAYVALCAVAACGGQRDRVPTHTVTADDMLTRAMVLEGAPTSWKDGLRFIMNKESGGHVGIQNPTSSARGLFQLTAASYHMNPHGAASFGNGIEEAQGGIRYIKQRYGTVDNATSHWQQMSWY